MQGIPADMNAALVPVNIVPCQTAYLCPSCSAKNHQLYHHGILILPLFVKRSYELERLFLVETLGFSPAELRRIDTFAWI